MLVFRELLCGNGPLHYVHIPILYNIFYLNKLIMNFHITGHIDRPIKKYLLRLNIHETSAVHVSLDILVIIPLLPPPL